MADQTAATSSEGFKPVDSDVREIIATSLNETLFVEASAGTGKTSSLVQRVVNLVASGAASLGRVAVITFTEAAAAELRARLRQSLENASQEPGRTDAERERCQRGISDLDQAAIRTLHAFAAMLLHERPLEAGLPPGFETSDEIASSIRFNDAWNTWMDRKLEVDSDLAPHLEIAITLGMRLSSIRETALEFHWNYTDLFDTRFEPGTPPPGEAAQTLVCKWPEVERLCACSRLGDDDPLYNHVKSKAGALRRLAETPPGSPASYRLLLRVLPLNTRFGSQKNWDVDPISGDNACAALKRILKELNDTVKEEIQEARQSALLPILEGLRQFALNYAQDRRAEGRAEFHDLLVWARELLRDNLEARDHFRQRFSHLLIDEAQDTDPIQAEIAMYLAESVPPGTPEAARPVSWEKIEPETGKLFVVGDPKQSIYRFRRADVVQMKELQRRMEQNGGRTVSLVQNFRSQKRVIAWVNNLFSRWLEENQNESPGKGYIQASYEEMAASRQDDGGGPFQPRVWALADQVCKAGINDIRRQEAEDIAALLRQMADQGWQTLNRGSTGGQCQEVYRAVTFSDICILMPTRTGIQDLERGLERLDIPYRLESASLIFETQEIRDLLNCLRAIDDPADQVATVAALRSPAFGCSDVDLLLHYESGGRFNCLAETGRGREGPVADALKTLRDFREGLGTSSIGVLIDSFVRERGLMETAAGHPRMREQWRRYRFMVEQARQFANAGGNSLRAFVEWIDQQIDERARVTESPVPESDEDAVRVMTIHAAKGLEFPAVILTGINSTPRQTGNNALFDRSAGRVEVGIGSSNSRFGTAGFESLLEQERLMSEAEHIRLMYVAATRARDHLILSLRRKSDDSGAKSAAGRVSEYLAEYPELWEPVVLQVPAAHQQIEPGDHGDPEPGDGEASIEHTLQARDEWMAKREMLIRERRRPAFVAATSLGRKQRDESGSEPGDKPGNKPGNKPGDKEEQESEEPWRRGRAGTAVGRAVHTVLQVTDLASGDDIANRARAQAVAEGIPGRETEVARLARAAVNSNIVRRAVASGRLWREVPVAVPTGNGALHGFIDLLFEESDGLVVVDYKTDSVSPAQAAEAVQRYRLQGGAYAHAIAQLTGKPVKEVVFLYLQPRREEKLEDLNQAVEDAKAEAKKALGATGS